MDVDAILSTPLCTSGINDFWAWHFERKGVFTVQSAYHMLVDTKVRRENWLEGVGGSSNTTQVSKIWTNIWKLGVP